MTKMKRDPFLIFYEGKDAIPSDKNPYAEGTTEHSAWAGGYWSMMADEEPELRKPMSDDEVKAAFAKLNRK
jgi:hypothetical protein